MTKKPVTTQAEWQQRLADVKVTKDDLNRLIADYLYTEGFKDAAEHFSREAAISPSIDLASIESRAAIKSAIQKGNIEQATNLLNSLNSELLDSNPTLEFHLLQQHLIELIRRGQIEEALVFAQSELAPRGEDNPQFLRDLEATMSLLAFELPHHVAATSTGGAAQDDDEGEVDPASTKVKGMPESISSLLEQEQRSNTARQVNAAILTSQSHGKDPKLPGLLKMLAWGESLLTEKGADYPQWDMHEMLKAEGTSSQPTAGSAHDDDDAMQL